MQPACIGLGHTPTDLNFLSLIISAASYIKRHISILLSVSLIQLILLTLVMEGKRFLLCTSVIVLIVAVLQSDFVQSQTCELIMCCFSSLLTCISFWFNCGQKLLPITFLVVHAL